MAGCGGERLDSEQEFEAVGACATAIEERLGTTLPPGWRFGKVEREDEILMEAWPPGRDTEATPPEHTCTVVLDERAPGGVRVVDVVDGRR